jgi:hypothetical protein
VTLALSPQPTVGPQVVATSILDDWTIAGLAQSLTRVV